MGKLVKILLGLGLVAGIAVGVLLWRLDAIVKDFKPEIESTLASVLKTPVTIGDIGASIFPSVSLQLKDLSLAKAENKDGIRVETLALKSSLGDLFSGNLSVSEFTLKGAQLTATRLADGSLDLGGIALGGDTTTAPEESTPETSGEESSLSLEIKRANIEGVNVTWNDQMVSPPQTVSLSDFSAKLSDIDIAGKATVDLKASLLGKSPGNVTLKGTAGNPLSGHPIDMTFAIDELDLDKITALLTAYGVKLEGVKLEKFASLSVQAKSASGGIGVVVKLDGKPADIAYGEVFAKAADLALGVDLDATATIAGDVNAKKTLLTLGSNTIDVPFNYAANQPVTASVKTQGFQLNALSSTLPILEPYNLQGAFDSALDLTVALDGSSKLPKITGPLTLKDIGASVELGGDEQGKEKLPALTIDSTNGTVTFEDNGALKIEELKTNVGGQAIALKAKLTSLEKPTAAFRLSSPHIEFVPILKSVMADTSTLAGSFIDELNIAGTYATSNRKGGVKLTSGKGSVAGVPLGALDLDVDLTPELITLKPSTISIFGGTINTNASMTQGAAQFLTLNLNGSGLQAEPISKVAMPSGPISFTGSITELSTKLKADTKHFAPSANGRARLVIEKGSIEGFNLLGQTLGNIAKIPGVGMALTETVPEEHRPLLEADNTAFDILQGNVAISNGRMNLNPVNLQHPLYILNGNGWVGFDGQMDIRAQFKLTAILAEKMALAEPKLKLLFDDNNNLVIPIVIEKKGGSIIVIPDTRDLVKRAAKNTAKEAARRGLDRVAPGLGGAADALDSLFK